MMMTLGPSLVMMVQHERKILSKKCYLVFCDPFPLIIVSNIKASAAGAKIAKNSTKCQSVLLTPLPLVNVGKIDASNAGTPPTN